MNNINNAFYINKDLQYFKTSLYVCNCFTQFYINKDLQYFKTECYKRKQTDKFYINKDLQYFKTLELVETTEKKVLH